MKLILETRCDNPDFGGNGPSYGLLNLTQPEVQHYLDLMAHAELLKKGVVKNLHSLEVWDGTCEWFEYTDEIEESLEEAIVLPRTKDDTYKVFRVADDFSVHGEHYVSIECEMVEVCEDEICWHGYLKHTDQTYRTVRLTRADLIELKDEMEKLTA